MDLSVNKTSKDHAEKKITVNGRKRVLRNETFKNIDIQLNIPEYFVFVLMLQGLYYLLKCLFYWLMPLNLCFVFLKTKNVIINRSLIV